MSNTISDDLPNEIDLVSLLIGKSETNPSNKTSDNKKSVSNIADGKYMDCENSSNIYSKKCNTQLLAFEKKVFLSFLF